MGPSTVPCGTPEVTGTDVEVSPSRKNRTPDRAFLRMNSLKYIELDTQALV